MSFIVPNVQDVPLGFEMLARRFWTDDYILGKAAGGASGVLSGLEVSEDGSPSMGVIVDEGTGVVDLVQTPLVPVTALSVATADTVDPRLDMVVLDAAGGLWIRTGTPDASPVPTMLLTDLGLAMFLVPPNETAITNEHIVDKRILVPSPAEIGQWNIAMAGSDDTTTFLNHATYISDPILQFPMAGNTAYVIRSEGVVSFSGASTAGGLKMSITGPASPTYIRGGLQYSLQPFNSTSGNALTAAQDFFAYPIPPNGQLIQLVPFGAYEWRWRLAINIHNGANAGTFAIQFAQNGASAVQPFNRRAGSYLEYLAV